MLTRYTKFLCYFVFLGTVACQPTVEIPTLAVLPTAISSQESEVLPNEQPEVLGSATSAFDLPSSEEEAATLLATLFPNLTPAPTIVSDNSLIAPIELSTLRVGDVLTMIGVIGIDASTSAVTLTDEQGNVIILNFSVDIARLMSGHQIYVSGTVYSLERGVTIELSTIQDLAEGQADVVVAPTPIDITPESTVEAIENTIFGTSIGTNLTALNAYDQLLEVIGDEVRNRPWISATGGIGEGWSFNFYDEVTSNVDQYLVSIEGFIQPMPGIPLLETQMARPLNRDSINVDSDVLLERIEASEINEDPLTLVFILKASDDSEPEWQVIDVEGRIVFSTSADSTTSTP